MTQTCAIIVMILPSDFAMPAWIRLRLPKISRKRIICTGHAYVALSRLRTLGGLILRGFSRSRVRADPQVRKLYKELLPDGATARLMEDVSPGRFRCLLG